MTQTRHLPGFNPFTATTRHQSGAIMSHANSKHTYARAVYGRCTLCDIANEVPT